MIIVKGIRILVNTNILFHLECLFCLQPSEALAALVRDQKGLEIFS